MRVIFLNLFAVFLSASLVVDAMPLPLSRAQAQAQAGMIEARAPKIKTSTKTTTKVAVPAVPVKVAAPAPPPVKVVTPAAPLPIKVTTPPPPLVKVTTPPSPPPVKQGTNGAGTTGNPTAGGAIGAGSGTGIGNGQTGSTGGVIPANGAGAGTGANTNAAGGAGSTTPAQPAAPAVDSCPTQTTCGTCVAAKDAEGKTCVFKFSAGVTTGTCSSAKTASGLGLMKTKPQCIAGEKAQLAAAEKKAKADALKLRADAKILFEKSNPSPAQGQSAKDHVTQGPFATKTSGRHLLTNWDAIRLPDVRKTATFDDNTGIVELDVKSAGTAAEKIGKTILKTVFNNEVGNTAHPAVWTTNQAIDACITAIAATLKTQGKLISQGQRPGGIVVTNPKGVNVCITVALETCFPSKLGAVTGAPGSVC